MSAARTHFIGDVHGCLGELDELLEKLELGKKDRVVFVGDFTAKGPDSAGVVARARKLGALGVLGNHDAALLYARSLSKRERQKLKPERRALLDELKAADFAYLDALPSFLRLPELKVLVVHGGLVPGRAPEKHPAELLQNMRSITPAGEASKRIDDGVPWASRWKGPELVVFGHDARRGLQKHRRAIGLDTGCVYGGKLTALTLPGKKLTSVRAHDVYVALGD